MQESKTLNLDGQIRELLRKSLLSSVNRKELCDQLTKAMGREISMGMLENWCAYTKTRWHLPADAVRALTEATGDDSIARLLLSHTAEYHLRVGEFVVKNTAALKAFEGELCKAVFTTLYGKKGIGYAKKALAAFRKNDELRSAR